MRRTLTDTEHQFNSDLVNTESELMEYARLLARAAFQVVEDNPRTSASPIDEIKALKGLVEAGEAAQKALDAYKAKEALNALFIHSRD